MRVRQHVNPLASSYQQPAALGEQWVEEQFDTSQPFHLDIGCAKGRREQVARMNEHYASHATPPRHATPRRPRHATPRHATPRIATHRATPRHATPRHATHHATPRHATPHPAITL